MAKAPAEIVWYQHKEQGTLHKMEKGSDIHKRIAREMTQVDETSDEVPELIYSRVSEADLKKLLAKPELLPGALKPWRRQAKTPDAQVVNVVQGPSDEEIQARIDDAVQAAVAAALATQTPAVTPEPPKGK